MTLHVEVDRAERAKPQSLVAISALALPEHEPVTETRHCERQFTCMLALHNLKAQSLVPRGASEPRMQVIAASTPRRPYVWKGAKGASGSATCQRRARNATRYLEANPASDSEVPACCIGFSP